MRHRSLTAFTLALVVIAAAAVDARAGDAPCPLSAQQVSHAAHRRVIHLTQVPAPQNKLCTFVAPQSDLTGSAAKDPINYDFLVSSGRISRSVYEGAFLLNRAMKHEKGVRLVHVGKAIGYWAAGTPNETRNAAVLSFPGSHGRYWQISSGAAIALQISAADQIAGLKRLHRLRVW